MRKHVPIVSLFLFLFQSIATVIAADRIVVDFENLERGAIVTDQFAELGLRVRARNWSHGPDHAVIFDTSNIGASDDNDLDAPLDPAIGFEGHGDLRPGNVLILHEHYDCEGGVCAEPDDEGGRPAGYLEFIFSGDVTLHGLTLIDVNYESGESPAQLVLFASDGGVLDSIDVPGVGGQGDWRPWSIERSGVARARLYLPGDAAIDELAFTAESPVNWAPEFRDHPPVAVTPDGLYFWRPDVHDADGDAVMLYLLNGPDGMSVTEAGELQWSPGGESGEFAISVEARDSRGAATTRNFVVAAENDFARLQDFEFAAGTVIDDELLAGGLRITAKNLSSGSDFAVTFDTEAPTGDDTDLAAPFEEGSGNELGIGPSRPGKVLVLHEEHDCDARDLHCVAPDDETTHPAGWIEFHFTQPAHVFSIDVFDITSDNPAARRVELFDVNDQPLNATLFVPRTGTNDWDRLAIGAANVSRMRVNFDGDGALDRLHYALLGDGALPNQPPVANGDSYSTPQDEILTVAAPGVLENDRDTDGDPLTASVAIAPENGMLVLNVDGSFTYTPMQAFTGADAFQYRARDAESESEAVPVTVNVMPQADVDLPVIEYFFPSPRQMYAGDSSRLYWHVTNAQAVRIDPGAHVVPATGDMVVSPGETTTYTLTASNEDGAASETGTVTVVEPEGFTIEFYWPEEGGGVSWQTPPMAFRIIERNTGIGFPGEITVDGQPWNMDCYLSSNEQIVCNPLVPISVGPHFVTARFTDFNGVPSNTVTRNFYVDMTPPPAPDASRISATAPAVDGKSTITGAPGAVEPGNTIQIQAPQGTANDVAVQPDGSFSHRMPAAVGHVVQIRAMDVAKNFSEFVAISVPPPAPVINITTPVSGALLNDSRAEIIVQYVQTGAGINHATLALTANGAAFNVDCAHAATESRCIPVNALPDGNVTVVASVADTSGVTSNAASVTFGIDTVPPVLPVRERITLVQEPAGTVTIVGEAGAVEAGATVIVRHGASEEMAVATSDGEFDLIILAETSVELQLSATDAAGNSSEIELLIVPPPPLRIEITSHADGESVTDDHVTIRGNHNGGPNAGVVVNGVRVLVSSDGSFVAANVPLVEGSNEIRAVAGGFSGETGETRITLLSDGVTPIATLTALQTEGLAPMETRFRVGYTGDPNVLHHFEFDANGDGVAERVFTDPQSELSHTYAEPGWYEPRLTVFTTSEVIDVNTVVLVASTEQMDAMFRALWNGWRDKLVTGDTEAALAYISPAKREHYRGMFEGLADRWPQIFDTFTGIEPAILSSGFTEYAVNRTVDGENRLFLVYFAQDENGVWRLHSF